MLTATHLHAMLVHFPIALLLVAFASEIVGLITKRQFFREVAIYLLFLGAAGTVASYWVGQNAGAGMEEGSLAEAMELHEQAGTISLILVLLTTVAYGYAFWQKISSKGFQIVCLILFCLSIAAIGRTGYLGGQLVFKHGAGVELALPDFN
jgi:uncharacterized membrane protein